MLDSIPTHRRETRAIAGKMMGGWGLRVKDVPGHWRLW